MLNVLIRKISRFERGAYTHTSTFYETLLFVLFLGLGSISIIAGREEGVNSGWPLLLFRTLFLLACTGMGRFYRSVLEQHDTAASVPYYMTVVILQILLIAVCGGEITYIPSWCKYPNGVILTYLITMNRIALVLRISKDLGPYIGNGPAIRAIADNAYSIMSHHYFGFFLVSCGFALLASLLPIMSGFDSEAFHNAMYFYYPRGLICWAMLYCIFGVLFSLAVHALWVQLRSKVKKLYSKHAASKNILAQ